MRCIVTNLQQKEHLGFGGDLGAEPRWDLRLHLHWGSATFRSTCIYITHTHTHTHPYTPSPSHTHTSLLPTDDIVIFRQKHNYRTQSPNAFSIIFMPPPAYIGEEGNMQSGGDVCDSV